MYYETECLRQQLTDKNIIWWKGYSKQAEITCWRDGRRFIEFHESTSDCKLIVSHVDINLILSLLDVL